VVVLGIDPGIGIVGYGALSVASGAGLGHVSPLGHGVITTPANTEIPLRLEEIYADLSVLIDRFRPDAAAIEELFFVNNITTGIAVAEARGVVLLALRQKSVPIFEYSPMQVKIAVTGYGKATKRQMIDQVTLRLGLSEKPKPDDAADALAVALCHACSAAATLSSVRRGI